MALKATLKTDQLPDLVDTRIEITHISLMLASQVPGFQPNIYVRARAFAKKNGGAGAQLSKILSWRFPVSELAAADNLQRQAENWIIANAAELADAVADPGGLALCLPPC